MVEEKKTLKQTIIDFLDEKIATTRRLKKKIERLEKKLKETEEDRNIQKTKREEWKERAKNLNRELEELKPKYALLKLDSNEKIEKLERKIKRLEKEREKNNGKKSKSNKRKKI